MKQKILNQGMGGSRYRTSLQINEKPKDNVCFRLLVVKRGDEKD